MNCQKSRYLLTQPRYGGGGQCHGGDQGVGQRVHPVEVDQEGYLDCPVDGPHGEVSHKHNPERNH